MNPFFKKIETLIALLVVNLFVIGLFAYALIALQMLLRFSTVMFSHYEFLGMAIIFAVLYIFRTFKKKFISIAEFALFTCFSITSLAVIVLPGTFLSSNQLDIWWPIYINYAIACWITLGVVATASQTKWKYDVRYLYLWFMVAAASVYVAYPLISMTNLPTAVNNLAQAVTLGLGTLLLLVAMIRNDRKNGTRT